MKKLLRLIDKFFPPQTVFAHCDIPCGIYDPHEAQMAAHTVLRMTNMISELQALSAELPFEERKRIISQIARLTKVKEEHAEFIKHQVRIIWGDYFKDEHIKKYKTLHQLVFRIMKQASAARQNVDIKAANELLGMVQQFAEIFWETKGRKVQKVKSGYPTEGVIVLPK
ncbi:superoxide dismutase, Ni [Candidatus Curtissbacteria bacterium RIFCSPHIGHO2_02_FULL_42_15]|uniref:Superoxide dismutase, Ni n=1 Tax=Candidatus Curtissbacteria bacterium RIFCSPHIGHO2_02_FULL_42_15 TaxID=1797716 RepID=A0A1F5GDB8_9BACT|nr:MAG: superoxide dismutase, Ni [Candidatus Curtissbacteria bacterium RIFCSPHIGHO2_02_FULL_42_15]